MKRCVNYTYSDSNIDIPLQIFHHIYNKTPQMAPPNLADPADWRIAFGYPLPQNGGNFPQIGGFFRQIGGIFH